MAGSTPGSYASSSCVVEQPDAPGRLASCAASVRSEWTADGQDHCAGPPYLPVMGTLIFHMFSPVC